MNTPLQRFVDELAILEASGMRRSLRTIETAAGPRVTVDGRELLMLCSNNYLGLADHPALKAAAQQATARFGVGSSGSRLISGSQTPHRLCEERIAAFKGTESALLFNSGYAANTGVLQGLCGPKDIVFSDSLNHASIIDGCRLSHARTVVYPHGDCAALEELLIAESRRREGIFLIVSDGVFSMDGDVAPLAELVRLKEKYDAVLMIDDAHGTGVLGANGRGSGEHCGCLGGIDLHMGTFGKALGGAGAYLAASRVVIDVLINRSRSFIFSTSLPPAVAAAAYAAIELVGSGEGEQLRRRLWRNRALFADHLTASGLDVLGSTTQIIPILTSEPQPTMAAAGQLFEAGIFLSGVRPPTVPVGRCRLRATVMATHNEPELRMAAEQIVNVVRGVQSWRS